jgi:hypothetical protein
MLKRMLLACLTLMVLSAPLQSVAAPACILGFKGTPSQHPARFVNGTNGIHLFNWCVAPDGALLESGLSCGKYGGCASAFASFMQSNFDGGIDSLWDANVKWTCTTAKASENSDDGRLCAERLAIRAANDATWFPAPVYRVAVNSTVATRPSYPVVAGVRSTTAHKTVRATVRAVCKPDTGAPLLAPSGGRWMQFDASGLVTLCVKEDPK